MKLFKSIAYLLAATILSACHQKTGSSTSETGRNAFFDKTGMDSTVSPGRNFFLYANGNWMKRTQIPPSWGMWGSFWSIYDKNLNRLHQIEEDAYRNDNITGSDQQQVGDLYASGMDTVTIDRLGFDPVRPLMSEIGRANDPQGLLNIAADHYKDSYKLLFNFYVGPDAKNSSKNVVHFDQARLGLPGRDYYLKTDSVSQTVTAAYQQYISRLFVLTGVDKKVADAKAGAIYKLEQQIADAEFSPSQLREPSLNYHKYTVADFQKDVPNIDVASLLYHLEVKTDTLLVGQPLYYKTLNKLLRTVPAGIWKDKCTFDVLTQMAPLLSKSFRTANFDFYNKFLGGEKAPGARWKEVTYYIDKKLSDPIGKLYVAKYFTAEDKRRVLNLVYNIRNTFAARIKGLSWMSPQTKTRALDKLNAISLKVGYPDKWQSYRDIVIRKNTYYLNCVSIARHDYRKSLDRINKSVDKSQWVLTTPTVDAFYTPVLNDIDFPAGFLQPPFFIKDADDAINYGAVGSIIGHEFTHGFDDQGRQYDKAGNLRNWWQPTDEDQFKERVQVIIDQYSSFTVLNGIHVNGTLSQGEAIADNGGLQIAYEAFKRTPQGKSNTKIDGLTPDQRFFLGFAQQWRIKTSDKEMRLRINTDPHAPEICRVNGTVSNMPAFYKAFHVNAQDSMYRAASLRVNVW